MANKNAPDKKNISSRNRNKNRNRNLQAKAKQREVAKKEKSKKNKEVVNLDDNEMEIKAIIVDTPTRENVIVVPERKVIVEDDDDDPNFIKVDVDRFRFVDTDEDKDGVSDKFKFVETEDEVENFKVNEEEPLEEFLEYDNVEEVPVETISQLERDETIETVSVDEEIVPSITDHVDVNARRHFSFESRIVALLVFIVVSFFIAGLLIFKAITHTETEAILYDEKGTAKYEVCVTENTGNQYYSTNCLGEDMEYLSDITEKIPLTFKYQMDFSKAVSTNVNYYVVSKVNIYREKNSKTLNTMEDVLVERTAYDIFGSEAEFSIDVNIPYKKYKEYVSSYNSQYSLDSYADLEVVFYVDNGNMIKKVASINLPLTSYIYAVEKNEVVSENQNLNLPDNEWGNVNTSYAVVGVIFVLFGVVGIIRLANLVFKVIGTSSMYQRKLNKILREYDKYIVISRGDYIVDEYKRLIKVSTFGELLDARNTLEKPIVYVKINNVKSEFYVEDSETVYKYTIKEADFEGK